MKKRKKGISIKLVAALNSVFTIIVLTAAIVIIGYLFYQKNVMANYKKYVKTVLEYADSVSKDYAFGDMIAAREMPEGYEKLREGLNRIKANSDIEYLYAIYFDDINDIHSLTYAINAKSPEDIANGGTFTYLGKPCEAGSFEDETIQVLQEAVRSGKTESSVLDGYSEEYGHMLNGYKVIFDSNGDPVGLMCIEIDINNINHELKRYVRDIIIFVALFIVVILTIHIISIERSLLYPITGMTEAANDFIENIGDQEKIDESVQKIDAMNIQSKNEIGDLYNSICRMETDMAKQYKDIRQYADNTLKLQNGLMTLMADLVNARDSDTGAHIQKTAAYVQIILNGLKRKGYYSEILTSQYMEDVVKSAPLHDVGKIHVPDAILHKTEKLSEEEFEFMKTHTTEGKAILDRAISNVEGESFLKEARNMAAYHHERWDGKGYPEGLHGEEIPLSARIMAVADVFDALISPRIYKPGFPLSKVITMLEEGKGVQFDPKCVEVFIESMPEVRKVLMQFNPDYEE